MGLTVSDLDASIAFYRDVAGFALDGRYEIGDEWFDTLTHNQDARIQVAMLRMDDFVLQLVAYDAGGGDVLELAHHHVGNPHLSITVDDVEERHARVVASGAHQPTPMVDIMGAGIYSFYVTDPDGVPVEFLEMPR
jgi:catechol 2,3-dioxygenase-like lactoylglutathione lyase family enzyme